MHIVRGLGYSVRTYFFCLFNMVKSINFFSFLGKSNEYLLLLPLGTRMVAPVWVLSMSQRNLFRNDSNMIELYPKKYSQVIT